MDVYSTPMSAVCSTVVGRGNVEKGGVEGEEETSACIIYFGFISMVEKVTRVERYIYSERSKVSGMAEKMVGKMGRLGSRGN